MEQHLDLKVVRLGEVGGFGETDLGQELQLEKGWRMNAFVLQ